MAEDFLHQHHTRLGNVDLEFNIIISLILNDLQDKVFYMGGRELSMACHSHRQWTVTGILPSNR